MSFWTTLKTDDDWILEVGKPADGEAPPGESGCPGYLQVIDCHAGWCGPCKAIQSTFKRIFFEYGDKPIKFYTADVDSISFLEKYRGTAQPNFLFYQDNELLELVSGVDSPRLVSSIMSFMPGGDEE
ncbi:hypothetical protein CYMTET_21992 [Cymbomonas tetramitiformis]|uniref:Thioredoxin domain-containing protein n=1 Tax=Cymbomonas tetramitiformis TaxID=36881 RepID=A0AAE0G1A2_9CHLO|nr:hypothetical protein CYMTET_21992 [Cymbomonas tetramitiformis]|eukprot:gene8628-10239_t